MNQTRNQFKKLFSNVELHAGDIIELQLDCVEERMSVLEKEGRIDDAAALCQEYFEWAITESGDDYGFIFVEPIKKI